MQHMLKALQMCNPTHIPKVLPGQLNTPTAAHTCPRGQTQQHATNRRRCAEHSSLVEPPLRMRAPTAQRTTSDAQCGRCWEAGAALLGLAAPRVCDKQRAVILDQHLLDLLLRLLVHVCARDTPHVSQVHSGASAERRRPAGSAAALRSPPHRRRPGDAPMCCRCTACQTPSACHIQSQTEPPGPSARQPPRWRQHCCMHTMECK
jgi:hypothetical protein